MCLVQLEPFVSARIPQRLAVVQDARRAGVSSGSTPQVGLGSVGCGGPVGPPARTELGHGVLDLGITLRIIVRKDQHLVARVALRSGFDLVQECTMAPSHVARCSSDRSSCSATKPSQACMPRAPRIEACVLDLRCCGAFVPGARGKRGKGWPILAIRGWRLAILCVKYVRRAWKVVGTSQPVGNWISLSSNLQRQLAAAPISRPYLQQRSQLVRKMRIGCRCSTMTARCAGLPTGASRDPKLLQPDLPGLSSRAHKHQHLCRLRARRTPSD